MAALILCAKRSTLSKLLNMDLQTEIAIEILNEITVLRKTLKVRMMDKLIENDALSMLSADQALKYILDTQPSIRQLADAIIINNQLLDEHLDYFFPMQIMKILIYK